MNLIACFLGSFIPATGLAVSVGFAFGGMQSDINTHGELHCAQEKENQIFRADIKSIMSDLGLIKGAMGIQSAQEGTREDLLEATIHSVLYIDTKRNGPGG